MEHVRQVVAQDLDLGDDALSVEGVDGHAGGDPAAAVHPRDAALVEGDRPHPVHQPHPLDDGAARAAQVHGLPAGAHRVGPLDDGDGVPGLASQYARAGPAMPAPEIRMFAMTMRVRRTQSLSS